ncbi:hypothetical protein FBU30_001592 [Linnemannia zychae]|nr:hypothetical protein FBU30_001592 [Linnemannia zychae]
MQQSIISGGHASVTLGPGYNSPISGPQQHSQLHPQPQPQHEAGAAAILPEENARDQAGRGQRRAASLWLLLKLAFGVYLFSQNGSIERIVLLHIVALIIFLHQTGRLRIVRRIPRPPQDTTRDPSGNTAAAAEQPLALHPNQSTPTQISSTSAAASEPCNTTTTESADVKSKPDKYLKENDDTHTLVEKCLSTNLSPVPQSSQPTAVTASTSITVPIQSSTTENNDSQTTNTTDEHTPSIALNPIDIPQEQRTSTWRHIEHGVLTFITSLIPTPPPEND